MKKIQHIVLVLAVVFSLVSFVPVHAQSEYGIDVFIDDFIDFFTGDGDTGGTDTGGTDTGGSTGGTDTGGTGGTGGTTGGSTGGGSNGDPCFGFIPDGLGNCLAPATDVTATLSASPSTVSSGQASLLSWSSENTQSCTLYLGTNALASGVSGSHTVYPTTSSTYSVHCEPVDGLDTYILNPSGEQIPCFNGNTHPNCALNPTPYTTVIDSEVVTVSAPAPLPVAILSASPTTVTSGGSSSLVWSSTNAVSCSGQNFSTGNATAGSLTVTPAATTNYLLSCVGTAVGGAPAPIDLESVTVTVDAIVVPPPSLPDLSVSAVGPSAAVAGTQINLSAIVGNGGGTGAGQ
jgi:hypothetical protein